MSIVLDGPASPYFAPLPLRTVADKSTVSAGTPSDATAAQALGLSAEIAAALPDAPDGSCVCWGIPFEIGDVLVLADRPVAVELPPIRARWLVFMHSSDIRPFEPGPGGIVSPFPGLGRLAEHAADYVIRYKSGAEARATIRRRHQVGPFTRRWGVNCFEAVAAHKPYPVRPAQEQPHPSWGWGQTRVVIPDELPWVSWLWAWENPHPDEIITGLRFEPAVGTILLSAVSAGDVSSLPLRWGSRRKALLKLPPGEPFQPELDADGQLAQIQLDLGQVISAARRLLYPVEEWSKSYNDGLPDISPDEILVEYTAHPDACFHLPDGSGGKRLVPVEDVAQTVGLRAQIGNLRYSSDGERRAVTPADVAQTVSMRDAPGGGLREVPPAEQTVTLRVVEQGSTRPVPVKLHLHGALGEELVPVDRHRIVNPAWFEDYSVDVGHYGDVANPALHHAATYINGETTVKLPLGTVYVEISKGFEIRPLRTIVKVTPETRELKIEIERVLPWRERGWVTADTHVHFLSPMSALLEGAAEGVNVVNLLASQWGELMTNVGDFDGRTTWGSREAGGDGEHLVRVGTENRQHVLGHISLLGYGGRIIAPMTTGGPDESALGDPVESLLLEWARQCRAQGGLVVLPHFPHPRAEHAAALISGDADAVEMTSWENRYLGIDPYSLSDWYRYLNCGYLVPAVGGTDKMTAATAVGTVRTYARIPPGSSFDYESWMAAVRGGETFVTYGPLLEFAVDGHPTGSRIAMTSGGGTVDVVWHAASVTTPMSRVELVVNGEIREGTTVGPKSAAGSWSVRLDRSSWLALLVRGRYPDQPEMIAAHSTPVMVDVEGSPLLAAADAVTILDQIEGSLIYLDTVGTRAGDVAYKRMRLALESAHRTLHNRLHRRGTYHEHTPSHEH